MKHYRLKKDLPTIKAGATFKLDDKRGLVLAKGDRGTYAPFIPDVFVLYDKAVLDICPNILTDWFEEIPDQSKTVWDLEDDDECWQIIITPLGATTDRVFWHSSLEEKRLLGLIAVTKKESEREIARCKAKVIIERDTKGFKPDWVDGDPKYEVYYDHDENTLSIECYCYYCSHEDLWFATEEDAEASIKAHPNEWKTYFGVEE